MEPLTPERRREQTRQHLIEAAATVFTREGFHRASLDEVAAVAGFTKGAVYSNFKNKDDLFVAVLDDRVRRQFEGLAGVLAASERPSTGQLPEIRELISTSGQERDFTILYLEFVLYAARNPDARAKLVAHTRRVWDAAERIIATQWEHLGIEPELPPRAVATISTALFDGLGIERLLDPEEVTDETLDATLAFFVAAARGLGAPM
jgi:AcrR family transcriptional regulator